MPINDPNAPPEVRSPRLRILNNGSEIGGAVRFEVSNNNYYTADTFTAEFALNADPGFGARFWGSQESPLLIDLQASLDAGQTWKSLLLGQVDHVSVSPDHGYCRVEGRDLTSYFIDTKTQHTYLNMTSSQVIEQLAQKHGMTADVTPTSTMVRRYYGSDHDLLTNGDFTRVTTEWNLMVDLAQHELYDIWVTGTTVHFHPRSDRDGSDPYVVVWNTDPVISSNVINLNMQRSMYMAKDIIVAVRSWSSKEGKGFTKFSPSSAREASVASGKSQQFTYVVPNLTPAQALDLANKLREDITKHERLITFECPGDLTLDARNVLRVQGTQSSWDQDYYIDSVTRTIGWDGFTVRVKAKNHSPLSVVAAL